MTWHTLARDLADLCGWPMTVRHYSVNEAVLIAAMREREDRRRVRAHEEEGWNAARLEVKP